MLLLSFRFWGQKNSVYGSLHFNNRLQRHPRSHPSLLLRKVRITTVQHRCRTFDMRSWSVLKHFPVTDTSVRNHDRTIVLIWSRRRPTFRQENP